MSRASGLCRRCGGPKRGRGARVAAPVADCAECGDPVCAKHVAWIHDRYVCIKCQRLARMQGQKLY